MMTLAMILLSVGGRADLTLVRDGEPQATIVVAAEPTEKAQLAAEELRDARR